MIAPLLMSSRAWATDCRFKTACDPRHGAIWNFQLECVMAPDQAEFYDTLRSHDQATLVGTVDAVYTNILRPGNCRRAN